MIKNVNNGFRQPVDLLRVTAGQENRLPYGVQNREQSATSGGALSGAIAHMVKQGMPIDLDRVVAVRNAIADGSYPVDPMKIAQKILEFDNPGPTGL